MTQRELARAAQRAVACLDSEHELMSNALFAGHPHHAYCALRAIVLDALAALAPLDASSAAGARSRRHHEIVTRCDVRGEPHKAVVAALDLSRRQFYRERHTALLALALEIRRVLERRGRIWGTLDLGDAAHALIEALRSAGQYDAVLRETSALAARNAGEPRETKLWIVASEAARYLARPVDASDALRRARDAESRFPACEASLSLALWIAIGEINLRWAAADVAGARAQFARAAEAVADERTLVGDRAVLYGVLLAYTAAMELDCGNWRQAAQLVDRAFALARRAGPDFARRFSIAGQSLTRLRAQIALRADGNRSGAIADHAEALLFDRQSGQLGSIGLSAASYAVALQEADAPGALAHARFGLQVVRRYYYGDRLARVTVEALPVLAREGSAHEVDEAIGTARNAGLGLRDGMLLDLAEAKIVLAAGDAASAVARAESTADRFERSGMHAWACDAELVAIEGLMRLNRPLRSRRRLTALRDRLERATAQSRARASALALRLAATA